MKYCMHAGGGIDCLIHTNSKEAYEFWHKQGERCFEFDVLRIANDKYIVSHDIHPKYPQYTIWDFDELLRTTKEDVDLLMIDYKNFTYEDTAIACAYLSRKIEKGEIDGKKIWFEVDNGDMMRAAAPYSNQMNIICCVDDPIQMGNSKEMRVWDDETLIAKLREYGVKAVSYPWIMAMSNMKRFKKLKEAGFVMFSRTRNNLLNEWVEKAGVDVNLINEHLTEEQLGDIRLQTYKSEYYQQYKQILDNL